MYDLRDIQFDNQVFLMNFDNILPFIKLNFEDKYVSGNVEHYDGNIEFIKRDFLPYSRVESIMNFSETSIMMKHAWEKYKKIIRGE